MFYPGRCLQVYWDYQNQPYHWNQYRLDPSLCLQDLLVFNQPDGGGTGVGSAPLDAESPQFLQQWMPDRAIKLQGVLSWFYLLLATEGGVLSCALPSLRKASCHLPPAFIYSGSIPFALHSCLSEPFLTQWLWQQNWDSMMYSCPLIRSRRSSVFNNSLSLKIASTTPWFLQCYKVGLNSTNWHMSQRNHCLSKPVTEFEDVVAMGLSWDCSSSIWLLFCLPRPGNCGPRLHYGYWSASHFVLLLLFFCLF